MLLTAAQRRNAILFGCLCLGGMSLFIAVPTAALLAWDSGTAGGRLLTAYTWRILGFTLWQAVLSTLLSILIAMPLALALARRQRFFGRIWIIRLMAVPMGLPALIGALGLIGIWGRQGLINSLLTTIGLTQPLSIYGLSGILLAHVFFNLPLAARLMLAALERLPREYWLLSASLGMRPVSLFRFIEWPALRVVLPGIAGLIFMLCATSFTLVLVLGGGPAATTLEVAIYQSLRFDFDPPRAIALSLLQIGLTAAVMALLGLFPAPGEAGMTTGRNGVRLDGQTVAARLWDGAVIVVATLFLLMPLAAIVEAGARADLASLVTSGVVLRAIGTSFAIALTAGILSVAAASAAIAARHAIADMTRPPPVHRLLGTLLGASSSLVLLVPPVVLGTGWFLALRSSGGPPSFSASVTPMLVATINALMALPFVMRVLDPAMRVHRQRTQRLAAGLGLHGAAKLRWIDLPVLAGPLLTALSFAMALSLGDLGAVAVFGSGEFTTLPWLVYSRLSSYRSHDADGLALVLGVICLALTLMGTWARRETQNE